MNALHYLWRHPRRTGFIAFNLIVLCCLGAWAAWSPVADSAGIAGVPNLALASTAIAVLLLSWIGSWLAWGGMVAARRLRHR